MGLNIVNIWKVAFNLLFPHSQTLRRKKFSYNCPFHAGYAAEFFGKDSFEKKLFGQWESRVRGGKQSTSNCLSSTCIASSDKFELCFNSQRQKISKICISFSHYLPLGLNSNPNDHWKAWARPHLRHGVQASAVVITLHHTINVIIFEYSKVVNFYKLNILMCYNFAKLRLCQSSDLKTSPLEIANY